MHIGCALSAWAPAAAFVPSPHVSTPARLRLRAPYAAQDLTGRSRWFSNSATALVEWRTAGASSGLYWRPKTRHGRQPRLYMSSNQGMNPETFTERAWDAMVRLPSLADANKAQVTISCCLEIPRLPGCFLSCKISYIHIHLNCCISLRSFQL